MLDRVCACVLMAGGAALAATIANCACVLIHGLLPVVLVSLRGYAMHPFRRRSHVADVVGTLVGLEVGSGVGLLVGIVANTLIVFFDYFAYDRKRNSVSGNRTLFSIL
jgi:hypothetical protein